MLNILKDAEISRVFTGTLCRCKHSASCAKLDLDSVKRIHGDIVVGIKKATWDKLKKKYRSGEEACESDS